jgi:hypothetical protein
MTFSFRFDLIFRSSVFQLRAAWAENPPSRRHLEPSDLIACRQRRADDVDGARMRNAFAHPWLST